MSMLGCGSGRSAPSAAFICAKAVLSIRPGFRSDLLQSAASLSISEPSAEKKCFKPLKLQTRVRAIIIYSTRNPTWEIILRLRKNWVCFLAVDGKPIGTCFVICLIHCSACVLIQAVNKSQHAHSWPCFLRTDPQITVHRNTIFGLPGHTPQSSIGHFQLKNPYF